MIALSGGSTSLRPPDKLREIPIKGLRQGVAKVEGRSPVPVFDHGDAGSADAGFPGKHCLRPPLLLAGLLDQGDDGPGKLL
jgi:hypothetical protein